MKKIFLFLIGMMMVFSFQSCVVGTYATTQDDIYVEAQADVVYTNVDFNLVIRYGSPYYYQGELLYYLYDGLYYYPFYYDNYWYVRVYRRPFNHLYHRPYFRPNHHDYRFAPGHHSGFDGPRPPRRPDNRIDNRRRPDNRRPDARPNQRRPEGRPNVQPRPIERRQSVQPRPSTTQPRGNVSRPTPSTPSRSSVGGNRGGNGRFGGRR